MTRNIPIRIERILDFYDVPQLFIARDAFETLYLLSVVHRRAGMQIYGHTHLREKN